MTWVQVVRELSVGYSYSCCYHAEPLKGKAVVMWIANTGDIIQQLGNDNNIW